MVCGSLDETTRLTEDILPPRLEEVEEDDIEEVDIEEAIERAGCGWGTLLYTTGSMRYGLGLMEWGKIISTFFL